jgi:hypothetical protein
VKVPNGKCNLCDKESGLLLIKSLHFAQVSVELASFDEGHKEVNPEVILIDVVHAHDKRVVHTV